MVMLGKILTSFAYRKWVFNNASPPADFICRVPPEMRTGSESMKMQLRMLPHAVTLRDCIYFSAIRTSFVDKVGQLQKLPRVLPVLHRVSNMSGGISPSVSGGGGGGWLQRGHFCFAVEAGDVRWLRLQPSAVLQVGPCAAVIITLFSPPLGKSMALGPAHKRSNFSYRFCLKHSFCFPPCTLRFFYLTTYIQFPDDWMDGRYS